MSKEQLLEAYLRGEISRRRFIHGLVAAGVSLSAVTAYSGLVPQRALAAGPGSYDLSDETEPPPPRSPEPPRADTRSGAPGVQHPPPQITLQAVRTRKRRVRATVSSDVGAAVVVAVFAGSERFGRKQFRIRAAAVKTVRVKLKKGAPAALDVVATATDAAGRSSTARASLG